MAKQTMLFDVVTLKIDPPLPCAATTDNGVCNRPAHLARAFRTSGPRPDHWLIMPICEECAQASSEFTAEPSDSSK
jgi:hypothetical protein